MANYNDMKVWDANSKGNTVIHCAMDSGSVDCAKTVMAAVSARDSTVMTDGVRNMLYQVISALFQTYFHYTLFPVNPDNSAHCFGPFLGMLESGKVTVMCPP